MLPEELKTEGRKEVEATKKNEEKQIVARWNEIRKLRNNQKAEEK